MPHEHSPSKTPRNIIAGFAVILVLSLVAALVPTFRAARERARNTPSAGNLVVGVAGIVVHKIDLCGHWTSGISAELHKQLLVTTTGTCWSSTPDLVNQIRIDSPQIDDHAVYPLAGSTNLVSLTLVNADVSADAIKTFVGISDLNCLVFENCQIPAESVDDLCHLTQLESLSLKRTAITPLDRHRIQSSLKTTKVTW